MLSAASEAAIRVAYPDVKTRRGIQNKAYAMRAFKLLQGQEGLKWLIDPDRYFLRENVLAELGRFSDDADLIAMAHDLCETDPKPTGREAVEN